MSENIKDLAKNPIVYVLALITWALVNHYHNEARAQIKKNSEEIITLRTKQAVLESGVQELRRLVNKLEVVPAILAEIKAKLNLIETRDKRK